MEAEGHDAQDSVGGGTGLGGPDRGDARGGPSRAGPLAAQRQRSHRLQRPARGRPADPLFDGQRVRERVGRPHLHHRSVAPESQHGHQSEQAVPLPAQPGRQRGHQDRHAARRDRRVGERGRDLQRARRALVQQPEHLASERRGRGGRRLRRLPRTPAAERPVSPPPAPDLPRHGGSRGPLAAARVRLRRLPRLRPVRLRQRGWLGWGGTHPQQLPAEEHHHAHHAARRHRAGAGPVWPGGVGDLPARLLRGGLRVRGRPRRSRCLPRP